MATRFFVFGDFHSGTLSFDGAEFHHMVRVTRHKVGDSVRLFDGTGKEADAEITFISRHAATLNVARLETVPEPDGPRISLAVTLPKSTRSGWLIEKAVELGVHRIIPIRTSRSVVDPRESKLETLRQNVIAASKQCGRSRLMEIETPVDWTDFLKVNAAEGGVVVANPGGAPFTSGLIKERLKEVRSLAKSKKRQTNPELIATIGPEGGFTVEEVTQAATSNALLVGLGPRLLRVETAAVMMASVFLGAQLES